MFKTKTLIFGYFAVCHVLYLTQWVLVVNAVKQLS